MSDERQMELAEALDQSFRDKALADVRARAAEPIPPDWDCQTCYACGDDLPKARAADGRFRCVGCQETKERGSKLRR